MTLRRAVAAYPGLECIVIKNKHTGLLRYPEVILKTLIIRIKQKPDIYLQTFRGYETLPFVLLIAGNKPVIFDEFINLMEWTVEEHKKFSEKSLLGRILAAYYRFLLDHCRYILADTPEHAVHSSILSNIGSSMYWTLPVGADEELIPKQPLTKSNRPKPFTVLYYGNMLPLHGLPCVLDAARKLQKQPIEFLLIGGGGKAAKLVSNAIEDGALITYKPWVKFETIPRLIQDADLCLAGPFGDTTQARLVITGKTFQYMAYGAPAVIGKTNATRPFTDKQNCLLVPLADGTGLAKTITWARSHPEQLQAIAKNGQKLYKEKFSQAVINHEMARLLDTLV